MERMLSGIKPSGKLTLGNYIGAIRPFVSYQDEYDMFIFVANLHAITVQQDPKELKENTKNLIALYLASGLDPDKVTIFLQSEVHAHAEMGWVLTCNSYIGELQRMTQYKDKTAKGESGITGGLFTYPCLMAGDILLYDADYVPVGIDQKQHVELARNIAERMNNRFEMEFFRVPSPLVPKTGAKIMSLQTPTKKMSKSDDDPKGVINLLDEPSVARKKIMSAVTDNVGVVNFDEENQPGVSNLLVIHSSLSGESIESIVSKFEGKGYGDFKKEVGELVFNFLTDLQSKYSDIVKSGIIDDILDQGRDTASKIANKKVSKIMKKMGLSIR